MHSTACQLLFQGLPLQWIVVEDNPPLSPIMSERVVQVEPESIHFKITRSDKGWRGV